MSYEVVNGEGLSGTGVWRDNITSMTSGKTPPANNPAWAAFGPTGTNFAYNFAINDYIQLTGFHIDHDIKRGSLMYPHVHWATNGTRTATVKWEISYTFAAGHNQANFPADTVITLEQAAAGTAWRHMITEASEQQAITAPEVDSLIIMRIKRITNGGTDNADAIFGLFVDIHYLADRIGTNNKAPDFYA